MLDVIERYDGDPAQVAHELVEAANLAGGNDNITAIFVAGSEFLGNASPAAAEARTRNAITKARDIEAEEQPRVGALTKVGRALATRVAFLIYGFVLGVALALALVLALRWPKP
jgi:hypothetical protein